MLTELEQYHLFEKGLLIIINQFTGRLTELGYTFGIVEYDGKSISTPDTDYQISFETIFNEKHPNSDYVRYYSTGNEYLGETIFDDYISISHISLFRNNKPRHQSLPEIGINITCGMIDNNYFEMTIDSQYRAVEDEQDISHYTINRWGKCLDKLVDLLSTKLN